jgi:hypothetical protein
MIHVNERLTCSRARVDRYRRLLATDLTDIERQYVERRLAEERAASPGIGKQGAQLRAAVLAP